MSTELTVTERAANVLAFNETKAELIKLAAESARIVEITNAAGYQETHAARVKLKNTRVDIEKRGKAAREDAQAFSKAVIAHERELIDVIGPEETRLQVLQDEWDAAIAREKAAKAEAERLRVYAIHQGIAAIRAIPLRTVGATSQRLAELIDEASAPYGFDPQEFADAAAAARADVIKALSVMLEETEAEELRRDCARIELEKETARLAAERAELERLRAEQAKREADERAKLVAEREAEEQRQSDARLALIEADRKAAEEREAIAEAERQKVAEELRMQRAAEEQARAERMATEVAERKEREAEEKRQLDALLARIEADNKAAVEQERAQRQREIDSATLYDAATEALALLTDLAPLHITTAKLGAALSRHAEPEALKAAA